MRCTMFLLVLTAVRLALAPAAHASGPDRMTNPAPGIITLTVDEAVRQALAENLSLRREALALSQSERDHATAFNRFYPGIDATGTLSRANSTVSDDPWSVSAGISSSLTLSLPMIQQSRRTAHARTQGLLSYERAERALRRDVQQVFYAILLRERNIALKRQTVETARLRWERSVLEYEAGRVSRYAMLANRVAFERQRPELANLEDGYREALADFALLLGLPRDVLLELEGSIDIEVGSLDSEALIAAHLRQRTDVRQAALSRSGEELTLFMERNRLAPSLSLSYSYSRTNSEPFSASWFDDFDRWGTGGALSIGLRVPLTPHAPASAERTARANQRDQIERSEIALVQTIRAAETEIEQLVRRIRRGLDTLEVVRLNRELARTVWQLAEVEYDRGLIDSFELRNARLEFEQAQLDVLEAELRIKSAVIDLEYATNASL
ncbi:MAG: TolC family protein [Spirochaetaceae bacterium]|nr:MAG: TolC family protein [Spirochaetaceae bacterium]